MAKWEPTEADDGVIYSLFWRLLELAVHRYGSYPTGQLLTVMTIILLDRAGYHPTVGELARITRLPKSTVSRYVSAEMNNGYVEEVIDPEDRRRRRLHPTAQAREEQQWHRQKVREIAVHTHDVLEGRSHTEKQARELVQLLMGYGGEK